MWRALKVGFGNDRGEIRDGKAQTAAQLLPSFPKPRGM